MKDENRTVAGEVKAYASPRLTVYGGMQELTAGGSGKMTENSGKGGNLDKTKRP
jgi:hypothetical protein